MELLLNGVNSGTESRLRRGFCTIVVLYPYKVICPDSGSLQNCSAEVHQTDSYLLVDDSHSLIAITHAG